MFKKNLTFFLLLISFSNLLSQEIGLPFIRNYPPNEYEGRPQIWDITQDNRGVMYFGGSNGLFEFDGNRWRKIIIPVNNTVRSVDCDSSGTIYVGSIGEFGYIEPDSTGDLHYVSLSNKLDSCNQDFSDIWNTIVANDGVYFNSDKTLFRYNHKKQAKLAEKIPIKIWHPTTSFFLMNKVRGCIYISQEKNGLFTIKNDSLVPVPSNENLINEYIWFTLPYQDNKFLLGIEDKGICIYNPNTTEPGKVLTKSPYLDEENIRITDQLLAKIQMYNGIALSNHRFAIATISGGIIIINEHGKILQQINKENGLQSQTVHGFFEDRQNGLWAALTYGISRLETSSPITMWTEKTGLPGNIYSVIRYKGQIYAVSNLGLFYMKGNRFLPVEELTGQNAVQCFGLASIQIKEFQEPVLLTCANMGVWEVKNHHAKKISTLTSYELFPSVTNQNRLWLTNEYHLFYLEYSNGKWHQSDTIGSFSGYPYNIFENKNGDVWLLVEEKPVQLILNDKGENPKIIHHYNNNDLSDITFYSITNYNDCLIFNTDKGIYRYNEENNTFYHDSLILQNALSPETAIIKFEAVTKNKIWLQTIIDDENQIEIINYNNDTVFKDTLPFKRLPDFISFYADGDSLMWIISSKALYQYNTKIKKQYIENSLALNRKVIVNSDSVVFNGAFFKTINQRKFIDISQNEELIPIVDYDHNNFTIEYALPNFDNENMNEFSYRLVKKNQDCTWSKWSTESKKEYTNLFEGEYIFQTKARNIYGIESNIAEYKFIILSPWYRTIIAYILYFILSIFIIWVIVKLNTRRLIMEKDRLEGIVVERTAEIMQQKEEITTQAEHLSDANKEITAKNEELQHQKGEIEKQAENLLEVNKLLIGKNEEIESKNEKITDSIKYAKQIQKAVLPEKDFISSIINEHFIFFKPRDIVSGDFYWLRKINDFIIIAAVDCTGHGVPGAFMSMLGVALLNEVVRKKEIVQPNQVLNELRKYVKTSLHQTGNNDESRDGMDMAICAINSRTYVMQYAGANNPVYIIRKNEKEKPELIKLEADSMPIGIYINETPFKNKEIQLKQNDCIYLFSDGYIDQFGGKKGNRFLSTRFNKMLLDIYNKPMEVQKNIIEKTFYDWKGSNIQVDDILVMGLRV